MMIVIESVYHTSFLYQSSSAPLTVVLSPRMCPPQVLCDSSSFVFECHLLRELLCYQAGFVAVSNRNQLWLILEKLLNSQTIREGHKAKLEDWAKTREVG